MKESKEKKKSRFFEIFNPKYLFLDFARITGFFFMRFLLRPKFYYYGNAPRTKRIKGKAVLVCNHAHFIDPALLYSTFASRRIFPITAHDVLTKKAAFVLKLVCCLAIERNKSDFKAFNEIVKMLNDNKIILIFPEGRLTGAPNELIPFKSGMIVFSLKTGAPIIPIFSSRNERGFYKANVMIGAPIVLTDYCDGKFNTVNVEKLTLVVQNKMAELKDASNKIIKRKGQKNDY